MAASGTSAFIMKRPVLVYVFVIVPRRLTSWLMMLLWYSIGTVTSTSMIGSRICGSADW